MTDEQIFTMYCAAALSGLMPQIMKDNASKLPEIIELAETVAGGMLARHKKRFPIVTHAGPETMEGLWNKTRPGK